MRRRPRKLNHDEIIPGRGSRKKRAQIAVILTDEQLAWVRARQHTINMSASTVIRSCVQAAIDNSDPAEPGKRSAA